MRSYLRLSLLAVFVSILAVASPATAKTRVVCVGDSITKGAGAEAGQDYPTQLGRILGADYAVSNHGVNAVTVQKATRRPYWARKEYKAALGANPGVVILMLGANDAKDENWKDKDAFLADYRAMVAGFAGLPCKPKVFVCKPLPIFSDEGFGINAKRLQETVAPLIEQVAKEMKVSLIDCYAPFVDKEKLLPDTVHPNAEGNVLLAKTVAAAIQGQDKPAAVAQAFPGEKSDYQGFDKYSFETDGRPCFVIAPKQPAPGKPWMWRARFPEKPAGDKELLEKGFHVAYMDVAGMFGSPKALGHWDAFYKLMTEKYALSKKVALVGISRGGLNIHKWAAANPEKVACIVGIAPVCDIKSWPGGKGLSGGHGPSWKALLEAYGMTEEQALAYKQNPVDLLAPIAKAGIPVLHIYSPQDEGVPYEENTKVVAERLKALGGDFTGIAIEVKRTDDPALKGLQDAIDKKNPKAVARAHSTVCGGKYQATVAEFILKHTAGQ